MSMKVSTSPYMTGGSVQAQQTRDALMTKYDMPRSVTSALDKLAKMQVVLCIDDSYSMDQYVMSSHPGDVRKFRCEECYHHVQVIGEVAAIYDQTGVDCYFLNKGAESRLPYFSLVPEHSSLLVSNTHPHCCTVYSERLKQAILQAAGDTPLVATLRKIVDLWKSYLQEGELALFCLTDGRDSRNESLSQWICEVMQDSQIRKHLHLTFVTITDEENVQRYFHEEIDQVVLEGVEDQPQIDVVGSFITEQEECKQRNPTLSFSSGMYFAKMLCGSIDKEVDHIDECIIEVHEDGSIVTHKEKEDAMFARLTQTETPAAVSREAEQASKAVHTGCSCVIA